MFDETQFHATMNFSANKFESEQLNLLITIVFKINFDLDTTASTVRLNDSCSEIDQRREIQNSFSFSGDFQEEGWKYKMLHH